jgi:hypothetical protein
VPEETDITGDVCTDAQAKKKVFRGRENKLGFLQELSISLPTGMHMGVGGIMLLAVQNSTFVFFTVSEEDEKFNRKFVKCNINRKMLDGIC